MNWLNPSQKRSILAGFMDIHRRMADMEAMLAQSTISSPFAENVNDLSPTESQVVRDYFARIRSTMLACLEESGIALELRRTSLRWALQVGVTFLDIGVAEMSPERLRGYGPLEAPARAAAVKIQQDLHRLIERVSAYLRQGLGHDLAGRLARLEAISAGAGTLKVLDKIITRWQLVEFRPLLDTIVQRLETPQFEIAVFGRVSSGKSSLLNHLAGMDVLPVGVTPITAVPTRLVRGEDAAAVISFAEVEPRRIGVDRLREYASEEGNPGNHKHVTGILVQLPSPRLREGVVLVDTPGIGSLSLAGSAETLAYLPRCDLGVVLIDAAGALDEDDLRLLRTLYEAAIPGQVVLSKADLLIPGDRERMASYIREHIQAELGLDLPVYLVSTVGADTALLAGWFEHEIAPLLDRHRALTELSLQRKIAHLRESVVAVLQTVLGRLQGGKLDGRASAHVKAARRFLDEADDGIRQAKARCQGWSADEGVLTQIILEDAAHAIARHGRKPEPRTASLLERVVQQVLGERSRMAQTIIKELQQTLARTLEALAQSAPLARADPDSVRDLAFGGLPTLDLSLLQATRARSRPWWAALFPFAAIAATRNALRKQVAPALQQFVELYDRQLQAWIKDCLAQLVEAYESQADVFREQARCLTADTDATTATTEAQELETGLQELQQSEPADSGNLTGSAAGPAS